MAPSLKCSFTHQDGNIHLASKEGLTFLFVAFSILYVVYFIAAAIYNIYFHPLAKFPGPKLWIAFPIWRHVAAIRGVFDANMREFHTQYGEVVRYTPRHLSFISPSAWQDIYGHGHKQMPKEFSVAPGEVHSIITANDVDHTRFRKALAHAFSDKALREQEFLIKDYVDLLIERLKTKANEGTKANMVSWYNYATFDIIGDLAFGEPFGCLRDSQMHHYVSNIFNMLRGIPVIRTAYEYPIILKLFRLLPFKTRIARERQLEVAKDKMTRRINNASQEGRYDFTDSMLKHKGEKDEITFDELCANAHILIVAGSETTATVLSGVTYYLLRNPDKMKKLVQEIRTTFKEESEIGFVSAAAKLPYMLACLDEAIRLYPPVPTSIPRVTLPGGPSMISGYEVPPDTRVGVHQSAAYWSEHNFKFPKSYIPERFMPVAEGDEDTNPFKDDNKTVLQPFSYGPRNCIGRNLAYNEMRLILARVLWNFDLELCEESQNWSDQKSTILWLKGPLYCKIRPRNDSADVVVEEKATPLVTEKRLSV